MLQEPTTAAAPFIFPKDSDKYIELRAAALAAGDAGLLDKFERENGDLRWDLATSWKQLQSYAADISSYKAKHVDLLTIAHANHKKARDLSKKNTGLQQELRTMQDCVLPNQTARIVSQFHLHCQSKLLRKVFIQWKEQLQMSSIKVLRNSAIVSHYIKSWQCNVLLIKDKRYSTASETQLQELKNLKKKVTRTYALLKTFYYWKGKVFNTNTTNNNLIAAFVSKHICKSHFNAWRKLVVNIKVCKLFLKNSIHTGVLRKAFIAMASHSKRTRYLKRFFKSRVLRHKSHSQLHFFSKWRQEVQSLALQDLVTSVVTTRAELTAQKERWEATRTAAIQDVHQMLDSASKEKQRNEALLVFQLELCNNNLIKHKVWYVFKTRFYETRQKWKRACHKHKFLLLSSCFKSLTKNLRGRSIVEKKCQRFIYYKVLRQKFTRWTRYYIVRKRIMRFMRRRYVHSNHRVLLQGFNLLKLQVGRIRLQDLSRYNSNLETQLKDTTSSLTSTTHSLQSEKVKSLVRMVFTRIKEYQQHRIFHCISVWKDVIKKDFETHRVMKSVLKSLRTVVLRTGFYKLRHVTIDKEKERLEILRFFYNALQRAMTVTKSFKYRKQVLCKTFEEWSVVTFEKKNCIKETIGRLVQYNLRLGFHALLQHFLKFRNLGLILAKRDYRRLKLGFAKLKHRVQTINVVSETVAIEAYKNFLNSFTIVLYSFIKDYRTSLLSRYFIKIQMCCKMERKKRHKRLLQKVFTALKHSNTLLKKVIKRMVNTSLRRAWNQLYFKTLMTRKVQSALEVKLRCQRYFINCKQRVFTALRTYVSSQNRKKLMVIQHKIQHRYKSVFKLLRRNVQVKKNLRVVTKHWQRRKFRNAFSILKYNVLLPRRNDSSVYKKAFMRQVFASWKRIYTSLKYDDDDRNEQQQHIDQAFTAFNKWKSVYDKKRRDTIRELQETFELRKKILTQTLGLMILLRIGQKKRRLSMTRAFRTMKKKESESAKEFYHWRSKLQLLKLKERMARSRNAYKMQRIVFDYMRLRVLVIKKAVAISHSRSYFKKWKHVYVHESLIIQRQKHQLLIAALK